VWKNAGVPLSKPTPAYYIMRSLMKLNATVTSRLPVGTAEKGKLVVFFLAVLDSYRENFVALAGELCSSTREVTVAFNFISEHTVSDL
jgi:hypothetical protein